MSKLQKFEIANVLSNDMPENFRALLTHDNLQIPLPKYDPDGIFRACFAPRSHFGTVHHSIGSASETYRRDQSKSSQRSPQTTMKDFQQLKMENELRLQDDVLTRFIERASEIEQAVGSYSSKVDSIDSETKQKTVKERIQEFNSPKNPLRYYTVTDFKRAISKNEACRRKSVRRRNIFTPPDHGKAHLQPTLNNQQDWRKQACISQAKSGDSEIA